MPNQNRMTVVYKNKLVMDTATNSDALFYTNGGGPIANEDPTARLACALRNLNAEVVK